MNLKFKKKLVNFFLIFSIVILLSNCGIYKKTDVRKIPVNVNDRVEKNIQEGKGFRVFGGKRDKNNGDFEFASSNEMWRASLNLLDFVPFSNVDYSGGIIITDWFTDENASNESLKITVKFLSNEIRSDVLEVLIHKKNCSNNGNCKIIKLDGQLSFEIKSEILKQATLLKEQLPNPNSDFKLPGRLK